MADKLRGETFHARLTSLQYKGPAGQLVFQVWAKQGDRLISQGDSQAFNVNASVNLITIGTDIPFDMPAVIGNQLANLGPAEGLVQVSGMNGIVGAWEFVFPNAWNMVDSGGGGTNPQVTNVQVTFS